jgi:hypothetical protein
MLGALDEIRTHGIAFDVAQYGQKVAVVFDGKTIEASRNVTKVPTITYESIISR